MSTDAHSSTRAGAVRIDDWERDIAVEVTGLQRIDGSVVRTVCVSEIDHPLTPATPRQLAAALIAAADEAEEMNGYDQVVVS